MTDESLIAIAKALEAADEYVAACLNGGFGEDAERELFWRMQTALEEAHEASEREAGK